MNSTNLKLVSSNLERTAVKTTNRFVLQHKSIEEQSWSDCPYCMLVAQYLIRNASHSKHERLYGKHTVNMTVGQFVTSNLNLAKLSTVYALYKQSKNPDAAAKSAVDRVLKILEKDGFLSKLVIGRGKDQCSVLTIKNWAKFQANNVSILKTIPKTIDETHEKTIETYTQHGLEPDSKTIEKTNAEPLPKANTNKGSKQQNKESMYVSSETNAPVKSDFLAERQDCFEAFWSEWLKCKKLIGVKNTAAKQASKTKFLNQLFPASRVRNVGVEKMAIETDQMIDEAWEQHQAANTDDGFHPIRNMQPPRFMTNKAWRD